MYNARSLSAPIQEPDIKTIYGRHLIELTTHISSFKNNHEYEKAPNLAMLARIYETQNTIHVGGPTMSGRSTLASSLVTGIGEVMYICQKRSQWNNFLDVHKSCSNTYLNLPDRHIGNIEYVSERNIRSENRSINPFKIIIIDDASNFKSIHAKPNGLNLVYRAFIRDEWVSPSTWIIHIH